MPTAPTVPAPLRLALQQRVARELDIPLLPDTAARVMAASKDDDSDLQELADLISHDQSLAMHVLRIANSAAYAPREPIASLQQAIQRMGVRSQRAIAVAVSLKGRVFAVPGHHERVRALWMHAAATAAYAREAALLLRLEAETAFLCGLLHDVGMPLALQVLCDVAPEQHHPLPAWLAEAVMLEFHAELGARTANAWRMGPAVAAAIQWHHDPARATAHPDEVRLTALADELAYWALDETRAEADFPASDARVTALALTPQHLDNLLGKRRRVLAVTEAFA
jgi:putative nucleotidyltransferase with HDIG domain